MPLGNGRLDVAVWSGDGFTAQLNRADTLPDRLSVEHARRTTRSLARRMLHGLSAGIVGGLSLGSESAYSTTFD
jgi:hypothetical protein